MTDSSTEEIKEILRENQRILTENNQMLRKMRRSSLLASLFRLVYFIIILSSLAYTYLYYIKPNMENIQAKVGTLEALTTGDTSGLKAWYEKMKTSGGAE